VNDTPLVFIGFKKTCERIGQHKVPIAAPSNTHRAMPEVKQESLLSHCYHCLRTLPCLFCSNDRELLLDARDLKYLLDHRPPATPSPPSKKRVCARRRSILLGVIVLLLSLFITLLQIFMPARPARDTVHLFSPPSSSSSSSVSRASKFWNCLPQFFLPSASSFFPSFRFLWNLFASFVGSY
jgi:hypothetical protein